MGDRTRGLFNKFEIRRADGSDAPGGKHEGCEYFVLDLTHDRHALPALFAYLTSARNDGYEKLADDLGRELIGAILTQTLEKIKAGSSG